MKTISAELRGLAAQVDADLQTFMTKYATIHHEPSGLHGGRVEQTPWGPKTRGGVFVVGGNFWNPLPPEGAQAQAAVNKAYRLFAEIGRALLREQPAKIRTDFERLYKAIVSVIEQEGAPSFRSTDQVLAETRAAIGDQLDLIANLFDASDGTAILVPDTNALFFNPQLEDWSFGGVKQFTIVLLPTVLQELDGLKVNARNDELRQKAEKLINRIKGYRSRGILTEGVTLRRGVSRLMAFAVEPVVSNALPWLDAGNADDRLLAGVIEVMRRFPHSPVVLVTRDLNLQNKAEFARIPFQEPPPLPKRTLAPRSQVDLLAELRTNSFVPPAGIGNSVDWLREDRER
jgi:hypothetical protein